MNSDYNCSLAYVKKHTDEISSVDISLTVKHEKIRVKIKPIDSYYIVDELEDILKEFQKSHLSRIKVNLFNECEIYLECSDKAYRITLEGNSFKIANIEEVEMD